MAFLGVNLVLEVLVLYPSNEDGNMFSPMQWDCVDFGVSNASVALIPMEILKFTIWLYSARNLYSWTEIAYAVWWSNNYNS